ncbi:response regulator [bacterium]|nr:response regulator [bacterium]
MTGPKVLVVDDDEDLALTIQEHIERSYPRAAVRTAHDGKEALRQMRSWRPDVMMVDIVMPELDGLKMIRSIRADIDQNGLKVIAMSGLPEDVGRIAIEAGAHAFFHKGGGLKDMVKALEEYFPPELKKSD